MENNPDAPSSRWGQSEPENQAARQPGNRASRWGQPDSSPATPVPPASTPVQPSGAANPLADLEANPQEPILFSMAPQAPLAPFPLPPPPEKRPTDRQRQQRSEEWLARLEGAHSRQGGLRRALWRGPRSRKARILSGLLALLCVLLVAVVLAASVPGLWERVSSRAPQQAVATPTDNPSLGALVVRSNAPATTLLFRGQSYKLATKQQAFWSIRIANIPPGFYDLSVSAPHYGGASGRAQIVAQHESMASAFLSLDPTYLANLLASSQNQISDQTPASSVPAGTQYTADRIAPAVLNVAITYRLLALADAPPPSVLAIGQTTLPPSPLLSGIVTPDILFTNAANGALVGEYRPAALPADHFLVALTVRLDASGQVHFALSNPATLRVTSASGAPLTTPGGVTPDLALLFALVHTSLDLGINGGDFTCIGLADALAQPGAQPNPEDGLMLSVNATGGDAHYFYRWGQIWTTNLVAHTLTPDLPQANESTRVLAQRLIDANQQGQPTGCAG